jgi:hypothetical protein
MNKCETCGNAYSNSFNVVVEGKAHTYDSFECAIHALAPRCYRCGCKILGHGLLDQKVLFCSSHCAMSSREIGLYTLSDQPNSVLDLL